MPTIPHRDGKEDRKGDGKTAPRSDGKAPTHQDAKAAGGTATVVPGYHTPGHYITEPDKNAPCSRYFVRRWMPLLGENGVRIVLALRLLGFYNWKTDERRDGIEIELPELAALVGVSVATLKREFGDARPARGEAPDAPPRRQNPVLHRFVQKEQQYWRDPVTNRLLRTANVYRVMMDDPIHEDDLPRLQEILDALDKNGHPSKAQNAPQMPGAKRPSKAQNELQVPGGGSPEAHSAPKNKQSESGKSQSESETNQSESEKSQNEPTLKEYFSSPPLPLILSPTPAAPGDSLSLFGGREEDRPNTEEIEAVRSALKPAEEPRVSVTLKEIEADWQAMPPSEKGRFRAEAVRQLKEQGQAQPSDKMVEPLMFKLFWVERKGLTPVVLG